MIVNEGKLQQAVLQALREVNDACFSLRQEGVVVLMPEFIDFEVDMVTGNDINVIDRAVTESEANGGSTVTLREQLASDTETSQRNSNQTTSQTNTQTTTETNSQATVENNQQTTVESNQQTTIEDSQQTTTESNQQTTTETNQQTTTEDNQQTTTETGTTTTIETGTATTTGDSYKNGNTTRTTSGGSETTTTTHAGIQTDQRGGDNGYQNTTYEYAS